MKKMLLGQFNSYFKNHLRGRKNLIKKIKINKKIKIEVN